MLYHYYRETELGGIPIKKAQTIGIVLLFLGILASSFTGTDLGGIHSECKDGLDNDSSAGSIFTYQSYMTNEQGTDANDFNCFFYPYADGNGESQTDSSDQYSRSNYPSIYEYHKDYGGLVSVCNGLRFSGEPVSGGQALVISEPIYTGQEVADATTYVIQQTGNPPNSFLGCPP